MSPGMRVVPGRSTRTTSLGSNVRKELGQAFLELGGRSDGQDVPPPQEDGTTLTGCARLGDLGLARTTGPDSDGLKAALNLAAPTGENAVGTHQAAERPSRRSPPSVGGVVQRVALGSVVVGSVG